MGQICGIEGDEENQPRRINIVNERDYNVDRVEGINKFVDRNFRTEISVESNEEMLLRLDKEFERNEEMLLRLDKEFSKESVVFGNLDNQLIEGKDLFEKNWGKVDLTLDSLNFRHLDLKPLETTELKTNQLIIINDYGIFCDSVGCFPLFKTLKNLEIFLHFHFPQNGLTKSINHMFQVNTFSALERLQIVMLGENTKDDIIGTKWNIFPSLIKLKIKSPMIGDALFYQKKCIFPKLKILYLSGAKNCVSLYLHGVGWWKDNFKELRSLCIKRMKFMNNQPFISIDYPKLVRLHLSDLPRVTLLDGKEILDIDVRRKRFTEFLSRGKKKKKKKEEEEEEEIE